MPGAALLVGLSACATIASSTPRPIAYCWLPVAVADRWLDSDPIEGYTGGARKTPDWRNNGILDHEAFTDLNQNRLYDPGEPFADANGNGQFDSEAYGALRTGYVPAPTPENLISPGGDAGLELILTPATSIGDESPGHYVAVENNCADVTYFDRATGGDVQGIDRFLRGLIEADLGARWDPATQQIIGSIWPCSTPRVVVLPFYDPRLPLTTAHDIVMPSKGVPVFLEAMVNKGAVRVVLLPPTAVLLCTGSALEGAAAPAASGPARATWGELKASYR
jgi:hypothetical protein